MKRFGGILLLFVCNGMMAQSTLSSPKIKFEGRILDFINGNVLSKATVGDLTDQRTYLTDSSGIFRIESSITSKHLISIKSIGYQDLTKQINIPGYGIFRLVADQKELDEVVVTAVAGATKMKKTSLSIATVSQKELNRSIGSNIIDVLLKSVPGISAITTGPNISKPFIRGLGYNRVLTLYDGMRQEGQQWGDEHGIEIDPYSIAKAEIVKGPASLLYGSDAIAGVVNLIPRMPSETFGKLKGDIVTEYHSNNGMAGTTMGIHYHNKEFLWSVRGSVKMAKDYQNPVDNRVYNTGFSEKNLSVMLGTEKKKNKQYLQFNIYDNLQEIPDGSRDSLTRAFTNQILEADNDNIRNRPIVSNSILNNYSISPLHQHIQHYRIYHKASIPLGKGELNTLFGFQQNNRREYNHPTNPSQAGLFIRLNTINYEAKYNFPDWAGIRVTYGINGMYQVNKNKDATDFPIPDYRLFDLGTFLIGKKEFQKTVISAGIRFDHRNIYWNDFYSRKETNTGFYKQVISPDTSAATLNFSSYKKIFKGVSASIGMTYTISNEITLKANLASGYRSPSIPEIGSDGLDPGAHIYYIGNRDAKAETNWQADIGLLINRNNWNLSIEVFNNRINNYIFFQKLFDNNGQPLEIIPGNFTYQYKQGSARLYGAEANFSFHPKTMQWLDLQCNLATVTGINTDHETLKLFGDAAKYLPLIPPFHAGSRIRINLPSINILLSDTYLQTEAEIFATQNQFYAVDNTETKTPGYSLFNLGFGTQIRNHKKQAVCQLFVNINNLFNTAYQAHQNRLKYFEYYNRTSTENSGIYNMGRNLAVKAIFSW